MPTMIREYIRSAVAGAVLAGCFVAALLALDVAHLRHLVLTDEAGGLAVLMLVAFNTLLFGGVQFAIRIMGQAHTPSPPEEGGGLAGTLPPAALTVATEAPPPTRRI